VSGPFKPGKYDFTALVPLVSLPFSGIVTTNYDTSLFEARMHIATRGRTVPPQLLTTRETKGAPYSDFPFVLHLHGRASLPIQAEQIVFDERDYRECYDQPSFTDGLLQLFSSRTCVFVGFSFKDPGIDSVLKTWTSRRGPVFPRTHLAILPRSAAQLEAQLTPMNVRVITYCDEGGKHSELWAAVSRAASLVVGAPSIVGGYRLRRTPLGAARDMLAMCYARASFGNRIEPLRNVVLDGIALAVVSQSRSNGIAVAALGQSMAQGLGLLPSEIDGAIEGSVERLARLGACRRQGEVLIATGAASDEVGPQTRVLAEEVLRRANLREKSSASANGIGLGSPDPGRLAYRPSVGPCCSLHPAALRRLACRRGKPC